MRVLYLANAAHVGGGNKMLLRMCAGVRDLGVEPLVVLPTAGRMQEECARLGLPCRVVEYDQPSCRNPIKTLRALLCWRLTT